MKYVILDVDGVIAPAGKPVSPDTSNILRKISERSRIVFISGKTADNLNGLARGIGLSDIYIIGENGGTIYLSKNKKEYIFTEIDSETKEELDMLRKELCDRLKNRCWFQPNKVIFTAFPLDNLTVTETESEFRKAITKLKLMNIKLYTHIDAVDAVPSRLDKGWALNKLSEILSIPMSDFIAVGDGDNDIPMLMQADLSIGVGNNPNIKKVADKLFETGIDALNYISNII